MVLPAVNYTNHRLQHAWHIARTEAHIAWVLWIYEKWNAKRGILKPDPVHRQPRSAGFIAQDV